MSVCQLEKTCPCMEPCPMLYAMSMLGGKWKISILCALKLNGPTRYNALLRRVNGITNTMLASSLRELERDGLIERRQYSEIPVRVEYSLTSKCDLLFPAFEAIEKWSRAMLEDKAGGEETVKEEN